MLEKVKSILVCAFLALGVLSCSSDEGSDPKPKVKSEVYDLVVQENEEAFVYNIVVQKSSGTKSSTDVLYEADTLPVAWEPGVPLPPRVKKWEKSYSKTSEELLSIIVKGMTSSVDGKATISILKDGEVVKTKSASGEKLLLELNF